MSHDDLLDTKAGAEFVKLGSATFSEYCGRGVIPAQKQGKKYYAKRSDLEKYLKLRAEGMALKNIAKEFKKDAGSKKG